jgi:glycosyltransferase involved in cell wall biosynthesis
LNAEFLLGKFSQVKKVSIITALHNKAPYVGETIRSVLAQTMTEWEMIVVENGSTDGGPEIVRQFADRRIRLVESSKRGPGVARNKGMEHATGEWILFLDADDLLPADYLNERMALAEEKPAADLLVGCWNEFKDGQSAQVLRRPPAFGQTTKLLEQSAIAFAPWAPHAAMIQRQRITSDLVWPEALDGMQSEDTAFWFPVICDASIAWTEQSPVLYRVQSLNSRNEIHDVDKWVKATIGVINHNVDFLYRKGRQPDAEQCASIVRVLESSYRLGLAHHSRPAAHLALEQATTWLKKASTSSTSMFLRRNLGLRLFNLLRYGVI